MFNCTLANFFKFKAVVFAFSLTSTSHLSVQFLMSVFSLSFSDSFVIVAYPFFKVNGFFTDFYKFLIFFHTYAYTRANIFKTVLYVVFAFNDSAAYASVSAIQHGILSFRDRSLRAFENKPYPAALLFCADSLLKRLTVAYSYIAFEFVLFRLKRYIIETVRF